MYEQENRDQMSQPSAPSASEPSACAPRPLPPDFDEVLGRLSAAAAKRRALNDANPPGAARDS